MAMTGLASFDRTLQKTNEWLDELMVSSQDGLDRHRAYLALRATLHALRDRLTPEEAVQLGAQLPMLIRGFYYEGWRPTGKPVKENRQEFLDHIEAELAGNRIGRPEDVARLVLRSLARHISDGEIEDVRQSLPKEIRELFD